MSRAALLFLLLAVCAPSLAHAQATLPVTTVVADAVAHNPSLAVARAAARQAEAEHRTIRAEWMPKLAFSEAWQRSTQPVTGFGALLNARQFTAADFAIDRLNRPGQTDVFVRRIGVTQILFDAGHVTAANQMARTRQAMADARTDAAIATLALQITQAYTHVIEAQAAVTAARAAISWAEEDLARATARRDAGTATDADVLAMSVHAASMRERTAQADAALAIARATVNQLAGAAVDRAFLAVLPTVGTPAGDLSALLAAARAHRPELAEATRAVTLAETALRDARGSWLPTIGAGGGVEWNGLSAGTRASSWSVGAELRWTLSTGGAEAARIAAAHAGVDAATAARVAAEQAIDVEVLTAREQWMAARTGVTAGQLSVAEANESLRITRERYAAGLTTIRDVLAATAAALDADARRVRAETAVVTAWAALERAVGRVPFDSQF